MLWIKRLLITSGLILTLLSNSALAAQLYYGGELCGYPEFQCIHVKAHDTWSKLFPDEREREMVKRLNRTNQPINARRWIVVPRDLAHLNYLDLSPFPDTQNTHHGKMVVVDLTLQAFGAYGTDGRLIHWGPISGGRGFCSDINAHCETVIGDFRIVRKAGPECVSSKFPIEADGGAPMPYCMYFHEGFALHGGSLPGFNASHGCVRLFYDDAEWLNQHFIDIGTRVVVTRTE